MIRKTDSMHLDEAETVMFREQLRFVKTKTYDIRHKNLKAIRLLPVSTEAPSGADTITFRRYDAVGIAKIVSDYANDFPRVDVIGSEETVKVFSLGSSYGYSLKEIRRAQFANVQLDTRRAATARRAIDQLLDGIAWNGSPKHNIQGFVNYPGITEGTLATVSGSKLFKDKTPDQIIADITGLVSAITVPTNGVEAPDTLLMPIEPFEYIASTRMTDGDSSTILKFLLSTSPYLRMIEPVAELKGAGVGGTDRMIAYTRDLDHVSLEIPQMFEQLMPQPKGLEFEVPCHMETAGVIVYYPQAVAFADGL